MTQSNASFNELKLRPKIGQKYFSLEQANRALIYIRCVTRDLMDRYCLVVDLRRHIEHPDKQECFEHLEAEYETAMNELSDLVDELNQVGVELKDFERGLVNFPAIHNHREVYLSWQYGEPKILAWHEITDGFTGRQDITSLHETSIAFNHAA